MYYTKQGFTYYTYTGQQMHTRAPYLIFVSMGDEIRAATRKVALHQLGHWMMGYARIANATLTVSGSLGNDGLPVYLDLTGRLTDAQRQAVWEKCTPLPAEVYEAWAHDNGHNGIGKQSTYEVLAKFAKSISK